MARFGAPHGVRGLLHLHVFSRQPDFFVNCKTWWCQPPAASSWQPLAVERCFVHSGQWLVQLAAVEERNAAAAWCNGLAAVAYEALPAVEEDTFYWCDLIGMRVESLSGEPLGEVAEMMDIGAHDVLCVQGEGGEPLLIPFVDKHVPVVDLQKRMIFVDWQRDW